MLTLPTKKNCDEIGQRKNLITYYYIEDGDSLKKKIELDLPFWKQELKLKMSQFLENISLNTVQFQNTSSTYYKKSILHLKKIPTCLFYTFKKFQFF